MDSALILFTVAMLAAFLAVELRKEIMRSVLKSRTLYRIHRAGTELSNDTCDRIERTTE